MLLIVGLLKADGRSDEVTKSVWWMPWHREAMKDVGACDKPEGAGKQVSISGFPNGETRLLL